MPNKNDQLTISREDSDAIFAALGGIERTLKQGEGQGARRPGCSLCHLEQRRLDSSAPEQITIRNTQLIWFLRFGLDLAHQHESTSRTAAWRR
jgi:hypothetical protein